MKFRLLDRPLDLKPQTVTQTPPNPVKLNVNLVSRTFPLQWRAGPAPIPCLKRAARIPLLWEVQRKDSC